LRPASAPAILLKMSIRVETTEGGASPFRLPPHTAGMRIGLFGGSFNPPHGGHRLASLTALRRMRLDAVWWLVTPGNPLKDTRALPPLEARMEAARRVAAHPRIVVTGIEASIGTRYTFDTVDWLLRRCPGVRFVWLMGADNLSGFHRWQRWRDIAGAVPIAVIDRPRSTLRAVHSPAGHWLAASRVDEADAALLPSMQPPAFTFLHGPRSELSSTALRQAGQTVAPGDAQPHQNACPPPPRRV
jgi:nicotinate-nucleotide adenylyltransferase